jgi:hypothetical protein
MDDQPAGLAIAGRDGAEAMQRDFGEKRKIECAVP